ncbi:2-oxoglutarate dehydrogenase E1 component [Ureibacillus sp. FSL K6-8385]|uniref:2-oxoglutarate dehydrogenase E1 component n=1 Tax=Ureibacillus terrenus TaxID=118246 RepID=A0A540V1B0_9BACL|nr:2-oxoglutarate dehydrogenase E1 component [Ureibacillus terrenus]MED3662314.1 2-oxoglutarate dehydrogenase E1 component [Ureibacillus terrenus]TQE90497.1 2-oxoglutarate dehydrogenase E1 component [Ureibacillus terrenus]
MSNNVITAGSPWSAFSGPNLGYLMEQYELYLQNPEEVDSDLVELFRRYGAPVLEEATSGAQPAAQAADLKKVLAAIRLADAVRAFGHYAADVYPLKDRPLDSTKIEPSTYGLTDADLAELPASLFFSNVPANVSNGLEAVQYLRSLYTGKIGFEYSHVEDEAEKNWIQSKIESGFFNAALTPEEKKAVLEKLTRIENFEKFIHKTFVGQKRFSVEGLDTLVVLIDEIVKSAEQDNLKKLEIGMAHRGRLNVLTHIVKKPYEMMFADFAHVPNDYFFPEDSSLEISKGWTGDVKYHMGATYHRKSGLTVKLAYNPSHLEVVSPVVAGATRAAQEDTSQPGAPVQDTSKALAVIVHGDAAFSGEGVVQETFNMAQTKGFSTGGSIHIISNNMIGFTTECYDSRSTHYSSDLAKGYGIPIVHVNADDPEAVVQVAKFAFEYRQNFGKDILIDLIGYRRYGHNETDDPTVTNPLTYLIVAKHPTVREIYAERVANEGIVTKEEAEQLNKDVYAEMQKAYDYVKKVGEEKGHLEIEMPEEVKQPLPEVETGVPADELRQINEELLAWPENFEPQNKLARILKRRIEALETGKIDWGHAETLAFASILREGNPIRISGQDAQRGTFSQRHLVLHDKNNGSEWTPLHHISGSKASFSVYNSPLTEAAIVGYEYGYNLENEKALTIWEAQFGDFANMAQMMFDNFISAARSKWGIKSGLVLLLPNGMEGQGPEHSSARIERYLQLCAENNWIVANCSNAGNYFHLLRRQAKLLGTEAVRPLVVATPKSLLRHPLAAATLEQLSEGKFEEVIEQPGLGQNAKKVERIILASGKVAIDLAEAVKDGEGFDKLHILRIEQLYPFPMEKLKEIIARYPKAKEIVWVQEEPKNQGPWRFVLEYLLELADGKKVRYVGRPEMSSTSEGDADSHKAAQAKVISDALADL